MKFTSKFATVLLLVALMISSVPSAAVQSAQAASCYWAQFIADVTIPDGTSFAPGAAFKKTWRLKNIGTCAWNAADVSLIHDSGEKMGVPATVALPTTVNPGQTVDITVDMVAPRNAALRHQGGDDCAGLHRNADDCGQPLQNAVFTACREGRRALCRSD